SSSSSSSKEGNVIQDLENERNRIAVEKKSASELFRSLLVYRICTINPLVNVAPKLIHLAERIHCSSPVYWTIRKTFFVQFCGGETAEDCIGTMKEFKGAGIHSILDLAVEADLNEDVDASHPTPDETRELFNKKADQVAEQIGTSIETASHMPKSFAAVKITSSGSPLLLQQVSSVLTALQVKFKSMDQDGDGMINKEAFKQLVSMMPGSSSSSSSSTLVDDLFWEADKDQDGLVDWVDWSSTVSLNRDETRQLFRQENTDRESGIPGLTPGDVDDYKRLLDRMEKLCRQGKSKDTRLMLDAEQTYFQPAIDSVAWHLQEQFNRIQDANGPLVYCTYQMYLKGALDRLQQDVARARRNKYVKAVKMVRGAYMVSERQRAKTLKLEDPIHANIEATHASYDAGVEFMLEVMAEEQDRLRVGQDHEGVSGVLSPQNSPVVLVVASHNVNSVIRTCERMQALGLAPQSEVVMFGQLMGMCDQISFTLGQYGYCVYKYIPYGPVQDVIPYLIRRAQENSSVLGGEGVVVERRQLWEELKSRL
ncbi:MAG: FAD-linked oxidoreductase-like protein, partial [Benniella sp.]